MSCNYIGCCNHLLQTNQTLIQKMNIKTHIYDVPNLITGIENVNTFISRNYNADPTNIHIFVMNIHVGKNVNGYSTIAIKKLLGKVSPNYETSQMYYNIIYIFTESSIECDDSCIIYLGLTLRITEHYDKINIIVHTNDDYTKLQHGTLHNKSYAIFNKVCEDIEIYKGYRVNWYEWNYYVIIIGSTDNITDNVVLLQTEEQLYEKTKKNIKAQERIEQDDEEKIKKQLQKESQFKLKYLKYKNKYLIFKKHFGQL